MKGVRGANIISTKMVIATYPQPRRHPNSTYVASDNCKATINKALIDLHEGLKMILERHKLIRIVDQLDHNWHSVEAYVQE